MAATTRFAGAALAAVVSILLALKPVEGWVSLGARRRAVVVGSSSRNTMLALNLRKSETSEPQTPSPLGANINSLPLNRREVLLRGGVFVGVASAVSLPTSSSSAAAAAAEDVVATTSSASTSPAAATLLSNYDPNDYTTADDLSRSVFPPSFLPPLNNRATYRYALGRDAWALEQLLAFANVTATIRTNVIELEDGYVYTFDM